MNVLVYGDYFGYMAAPWYRNGHFVLLVHERFIDGLQDHRNATKAFGIELATKEELLLLCEEYEIDIILSSPPSREIVTVGSRYWKDKEEKHPGFQDIAIEKAKLAYYVGEELKIPWTIELPPSCLSTRWRKCNYTYDPFQYGGFLPRNDRHPDYPKYFPPRDAYSKRVSVWYGNGIKKPRGHQVSLDLGRKHDYMNKIGGKGSKDINARYCLARGHAIAIYEEMKNYKERVDIEESLNTRFEML